MDFAQGRATGAEMEGQQTALISRLSSWDRFVHVTGAWRDLQESVSQAIDSLRTTAEQNALHRGP
jgi:hypothetical protein